MTRERIPAFDLYGELEVSPAASAEVIEAAYRTLAKRHHPDVASTADAERIKRLNVAREWLTDLSRRRRYDAALGRGLPPRPARAGRGTVRRASGPAEAPAAADKAGRRGAVGPDPATESRPSAADDPSFGPNTTEVRQFLADLRALDEARARQVREGRRAVDAVAYAAARRAMDGAAAGERLSEARFARQAASVVVRGKLDGSALAADVGLIVADVAGAIALRDLLPRADFELLLAPWTWRGGRISTAAPGRGPVPPKRAPEAHPAPFGAATPPPRPASPARPPILAPPSRGVAVAVAGPALVAIVALVALGGAIALLNRPPGPVAGAATASPAPIATTAVGAATDAPGPLATPALASPTPSGVIDAAQLRELRRGAARTIRTLAAAAGTGDVQAARSLLGGTAPGLQASGLRRAEFPDVGPEGIAIQRTADGWLATAGGDTLTSADGETWTFDYGQRPLAWFGKTAEHNLFWLDPRHDLYLRVTSATVTGSGVTVRFAWRYGAAADAAFFRGARLVVSSLTVASDDVDPSGGTLARLGDDGSTSLVIPGELRGASRLTLVASVTVASSSGVRTVQSTFELGSG